MTVKERMELRQDTVVRLGCGAIAKIKVFHSWYDGYCPVDVEVIKGLELLPKECQEALNFWKFLRIDCASRGGKVDIVEVVKQLDLFEGAA